jgi:hypothetical protein
MNKGSVPISSKGEDLSHMLRCEGTKTWRDEIFDKRFEVYSDICIRRVAEFKNKKNPPWLSSASELCRPSDRRFLAK